MQLQQNAYSVVVRYMHSMAHRYHHHTIHAGTHNACLLLPKQLSPRVVNTLCASSKQPNVSGEKGSDADIRQQHATPGKHAEAKQRSASDVGADHVKDTPDRSFRRRAQKQGTRQSATVPVPFPMDSPQQPAPAFNYVAGVDEPQLLPGLVSFPSTSGSSPAGATLQQLLDSTQDPAEREQLVRTLEAQYDQQLMAQLQDMPPEDRAKLIEAASAPENDIGWWEQQLLTPVMQDQLREDLGPELSEIMDVLLGLPPYSPQGNSAAAASQQEPRRNKAGRKASTSGKRRLRLNQPARERPPKLAYDPNVMWQAPESESKATLRKRLVRLTPEQKARLPELFTKLTSLERTYDTAGQVVDMYETVQERGQQLKYLRLARRARARGLALPDPPQTSDEALLWDEGDDVMNSDQHDQQVNTEGRPDSTEAGQQPLSDQQQQQRQQQQQQEGALQQVEGPAQYSRKLQQVRQVLESKGHLQADASTQPVVAAQDGDSTATVYVGSQADSTGSDAIDASVEGRTREAMPAGTSTHDSSSSNKPDGDVSNDGQGSTAATNSEVLRQTALTAGLSADVADLVARLNTLYERYNPSTGTGWEEEGYTGSSEMQCLKRAALTLAGAARVTNQEELDAVGMSADELSLHMSSATNDIMALMEMEAAAGAQGLPDPAVHACLLYLRTQLLQPADQATQQAQTPVDNDDNKASAQPVMTLPVDKETTDRLLRIIAASEVWEALHTLSASWAAVRKEGNALARMLFSMSRLGQGDPAWWAKEYNDMTAAEQSMVLRKQLEARVRAREGVLGPVDGQQQQQEQQDPMAGLLSDRWLREAVLIADEERISALASLDTGAIRCLQELEEQNYSEDALMKWSLHPVVGPRLTAGLPLMDFNTMHPWFQDVLAEAQNHAAEGLDFEWRMLSRGHPLAQKVVAQQQPRSNSKRGSKKQAGGLAGVPKRVRNKLNHGSAAASVAASGMSPSEANQQ